MTLVFSCYLVLEKTRTNISLQKNFNLLKQQLKNQEINKNGFNLFKNFITYEKFNLNVYSIKKKITQMALIMRII